MYLVVDTCKQDTKQQRVFDARAAQRIAVQLPQARPRSHQEPHDLARAAVGWNGVLGCPNRWMTALV
jgi:hypothetical protein